jgi:hypothetical protein
VEVGDNGALALGDRDMLMAGALDNGKRNDLVRHCTDRLVKHPSACHFRVCSLLLANLV